MISKNSSFYGVLAGAIVLSGVLAGCGGSSSSVQGLNPFVPITGGVTGATTATATTSIPASSSPQQLSVTLPDGTSQTCTVPVGQTIAAGSVVGIIPPNQPIIGGITYAGPKKKAAPGDLFVDGADSGIQVNPDTSAPEFVVLPPGNHTLQENGPFDISAGSGQLTVQHFVFRMVVSQILGAGFITLPTSVDGRIPANGGSTANGNGVTVDVSVHFVNNQAALKLSWPGVNKVQTQTLVTVLSGFTEFGQATFHDPLSDSSDTIPSTGVDTVELDIN